MLLRFQAGGFSVTQCKIKEQNGYNPLWIITHKDEFEDGVDALFTDLLAQLRADPGIYGFMECEAVLPGSVTEFEQTPFKPAVALPLRDVPFVVAERKADIHVFRSKNTLYDELDSYLETVVFYEVLTSEERIWTFLMGSTQDAESLYIDLIKYFTQVGGISKIEKEIVRLISPSPERFQMRPVAEAGFYSKQ